jgi:Phosphotransferase enzyme family
MTAAIASRYPGAHVADVTLVMNDSGNNRRARFALRYDTGSGPASVFAKGEGDFREVHARNGNMFNEADLYASGVPLALDHPAPYGVVIDRPGLDYVIVMEDVLSRGGDPRDATRPMTVSQVASGLRGLARLHSQFWGLTETTHPALAWVQPWAATEGFKTVVQQRIADGLSLAAERVPAQLAAYGDTLIDLMAGYIGTLTRGPVTLLHGDAHIGNTYVLPGDDVGFLDWAVVRRGNWSQDVGYFLVSALTVADRRAHEAELIELYTAALEVDERPSADEAWLRYRASAAYGLPIWLATLSALTSQPRDVCLDLCERYAAAFADLDVVGALAALGA